MVEKATSPGQLIEQKEKALLRILQVASTRSAQVLMYASALGAIALTLGSNPSEVLVSITAGVGFNLLSSIIDRVAAGNKVSNQEILDAIDQAVMENNIDKLLTSNEFQRSFAKSFRQLNQIDLAIRGGQLTVAAQLKQQYEQYETLSKVLQDSFEDIRTGQHLLHEGQEKILGYLENQEEVSELKLELADAHSRRIHEIWDKLRTEANNGYKEAIRNDVVALVLDMETVDQDNLIGDDLKGQIYRLAASVFLPNRPGGDLKKCRNFLEKAQTYALGEALVKCKIIEALLAYLTRGLQDALAIVAEQEGVESDRFRFGLFIESNDWANCDLLLQSYDELTLLRDKDWLRLVVLYYAGIGEFAKAEELSDRLISGVSNADHYMIVGIAWVQLAYNYFNQFCEKNNICPAFHLELELDELINTKAREKAADMFFAAYELYRAKNCVSEARQALMSALRLEMDVVESKRREKYLEQLQEIAPRHPLVTAAPAYKQHYRQSATFSRLQQIEILFADPGLDPSLTLGLVAQMVESADADLAEQVANRLAQRGDRFEENEVTFVQFLYTTSYALLQADPMSDNARDWLETLQPPDRYSHLRLLLQVLFYAHADSARATESLERALAEYPEHPEVLAVASKFLWLQGNYRRQVEIARKLFHALPVAPTAESLLNGLLGAKAYEELLEFTRTLKDVELPEETWRTASAFACLRLGKVLDARDHLIWLREHRKARLEDLLNLARINQHLGQQTDAFIVLKECVDQHPDEPDAYMELSRAYMDYGQRNESYSWILRARVRFPNNAAVATELIHTSYLTGLGHVQAQKIFEEFKPGGRFEASGLVRLASAEEISNIAQFYRESDRELRQGYQRGKIASLMFCYYRPGLPISLFQFHHSRIRSGTVRYAAAGDQIYDDGWLKKNNPEQVVLDYTSLLTLWSLYGKDWAEQLRGFFRKVLVPEKLLVLISTDRRLLQQGVLPSWRQWIPVIRDVFEDNNANAHVLPGTEFEISKEYGAPYIDDLDIADHESDVQTIGFGVVGRTLARSGEIGIDVHRQFREGVRPLASNEKDMRLERGSRLVLSLSALMHIAQTGVLEPLCNYFGEILLSQNAWQQLQTHLIDYEHTELMTTEIVQMQHSLGEEIQRGNIEVAACPPDQYIFSKQRSEEGDSISNDTVTNPDFVQLVLAYFDDLLWLSDSFHAPIWTDDRWISKLYLDERKAPFIFGTDSLFEWIRTKNASVDDSYAKYGRLIEWGYSGLPLNPNYVMWLINQELEPEMKMVAEALSLPRQYLLEIWQASRTTSEISTNFGVKLLHHYNSATISILIRCFENQIPEISCAALLTSLDLTRYTSITFGREPRHFSSLIFQAATGDWVDELQSPSNLLSVDKQRASFCFWLDGIFMLSGLSRELLQEAWYEVLQMPVTMHSEAQDKNEKLAAAIFAHRLFDTAPEHVKNYLLSSDLGLEMRRAFGLVTQQLLSFSSHDGTISVTIQEEEWEKDMDMSIKLFMSEESDETIVIGTVAIKAEWVAPGSIFLCYKEIPAEILSSYPDINFSGPTCRSILTFASSRDFQERLVFWRQGLRKLESLGLAGDKWLAKREQLKVADVEEAEGLGSDLLDHLLGQKTIIVDYLSEALSVSADAAVHFLANVESRAVRQWMNIPDLNWGEVADLITWADKSTDGLQLNEANLASDKRSLKGRQVPHGHSIFPDGLVWQQAVFRIFEEAAASEISDIVEAFLWLAEQTRSLALRVNIVLVLLRVEGALEHEGVSERVENLIHRTTSYWKPPYREDLPYYRLQHTLCDYLYSKWQIGGSAKPEDLRELTYLAYLGADYLATKLSERASIPVSVIEQLSTKLSLETVQQWAIQGVEAQQPTGIFKPRWGLNINYSLSYFLGAIRFGGFAIRLTPEVRRMLLDAGSYHRLIQTFFPTPKEADWLSLPLEADIGLAVAEMLHPSLEQESKEWTHPEIQKWNICANPKAGISIVKQTLAQLSVTEKEEVRHLVLLAFAVSPAWSKNAYSLVELLLDRSVLVQIQSFPSVYADLIVNLIQLLATRQDISNDLKDLCTNVAFGLPKGAENFTELIEAQGQVLSQAINFRVSNSLEKVAEWLEALLLDVDIPISDARHGLMPFIKLLPAYPDDIRRTLGDRLLAIADDPRTSHLWEFDRIRRGLIDNLSKVEGK